MAGKKILLIVPDGTRTAPLGEIFRPLHFLLSQRGAQVDVLVALGTHPPMPREAILARLQIDEQEMSHRFHDVPLLNHRWDLPDCFATLGVIPAREIERLSESRLSLPVRVMVNKLIFHYDILVIVGPVFPHEVVGFSGGNKYFFPGISGGEIINVTHWLGALITCREIIGRMHTPVRKIIDRAAAMIDRPKICVAMVVGEGGLVGLFVGSPEEAWQKAAELSQRVHIRRVPHSFRQVLAVMPEMYTDMWTAAKGMYKLEPVVADGGELIIYAPHVKEFSHTHGEVIERIGYHVRDYFVAQWDRFHNEPWGVLAHSTHLRGAGEFVNGVEAARIRVSLATGISPERCQAVCLGYRDFRQIEPHAWKGREEEGMLLVEHAGEILYRLEEDA